MDSKPYLYNFTDNWNSYKQKSHFPHNIIIQLTEVHYWHTDIMHYTDSMCINNQIRLHE